jgi:hypothetical protein
MNDIRMSVGIAERGLLGFWWCQDPQIAVTFRKVDLFPSRVSGSKNSYSYRTQLSTAFTNFVLEDRDRSSFPDVMPLLVICGALDQWFLNFFHLRTPWQPKLKLRGLSPRANYTDIAAAAGRRS